MATSAIKLEIKGHNERIESLLERQTWLDDLRRVKIHFHKTFKIVLVKCLKELLIAKSDEDESKVFTVCHGEPWYGNVLFRYQMNQKKDMRYCRLKF